MKRWQHSKKGSAIGSGIRQGLVKFGTGKGIILRNGISICPTSSQVNIDANTGEIYVYCNVFVEASRGDVTGDTWAEYGALTPEEVTDLFDYYSTMTFEDAYNTLYDTDPEYFSEYATRL